MAFCRYSRGVTSKWCIALVGAMALLQAGMDDITPLTSSATPVRPAPELSIIVPTFNERTNVPLLPHTTGKSCSSTTTRLTAPPPPRERSAKATAACAAFAASAAEVLPAPA